MRDILTMIWKEWKDLVFQEGGIKALARPAIMLGITGVYLPLSMGEDWLALPLFAMFLTLWAPLFLIISIVGDSFAGERERHTLETLLATRMPDHAILFGKAAVVMAFGTAMMLASLLLGLVVTNIVHSGGHWSFYPVRLLLAVIALGVSLNLFGTMAGILVSLRASTVRQTQQTLTISTLVVAVAIGLGVRYLPYTFLHRPAMDLLLMGLGILLAIDAVLTAITLARFQRARLILG